MQWSYSASRVFNRCQRKWFFHTVWGAKWRAKEGSLEREAYILSNLSTLSAWRGQIVDLTLEELLRKSKRLPSLESALNYANRIFDSQLEFARHRRARDPGMTKNKGGSSFAALTEYEYDQPPSKEALRSAREEVRISLSNLLHQSEALEPAREAIQAANKTIPQRPLQIKRNGMNLKAIPDLFSFYARRAPTIVDWKVHAMGNSDAKLQLSVYAVALSQVEPHVDFFQGYKDWSVTDYDLLEAQLLIGQLRRYKLDENDYRDALDYIDDSMTSINETLFDRDPKSLTPTDFDVPNSVSVCEECQYRRICYEKL